MAVTRRVVVAMLAVALLAVAPPLASAAKRSWAQKEIKLVTSRGLMTAPGGSFRPDDPISQGELAELVTGVTAQPTRAPASPGSKVTIAQLDAQLVDALGLGDDAARFYRAARAVGTKPPARFGREVVARLLGLRYNHPAADDGLELLWSDPAPRAEAAYSAAQILRFRGWETGAVEAAAAELVLPELTDSQQRILTYAFGLVGYPYVWGGTSTKRQAPFGVSAPGGFDCSGFLWQVYKLHAYPGLEGLGQVIRGRTAAQMAGEVKGAKRISYANLEPGDLLFFGSGGPRAQASSVNHAGIYVGSEWMVHSSRYGVTLVKVDGWYRERFAWGRRPLAEAGLF
jgi:cell wall-associated NlpC family hydrolase